MAFSRRKQNYAHHARRYASVAAKILYVAHFPKEQLTVIVAVQMLGEIFLGVLIRSVRKDDTLAYVKILPAVAVAIREPIGLFF